MVRGGGSSVLPGKVAFWNIIGNSLSLVSQLILKLAADILPSWCASDGVLCSPGWLTGWRGRGRIYIYIYIYILENWQSMLKCCEHNISYIWKSCEIERTHYFQIDFISIWYSYSHFLGPGHWPGPQSSGGPGPGPGPCRSPGLPICENTTTKIIWNKCEYNAMLHFHMIVIFISYGFHISFMYLCFVLLFSWNSGSFRNNYF